jgi:hypothetical protein
MVPVIAWFSYALSQRLYYTLRDIERETGEEFGHRWGDYVEYWAEDSIRHSLPSADVAMNLEYTLEEDSKEYECDLLVRQADTLLIVECKSKRLTVGSRSGDYDQTQEDIAKGVEKGTEQADRLLSGLKQNEVEFSKNIDELGIDPDGVDQYIPIVVSGSSYGRIATREYPRTLSQKYHTSYVLNVYDLEILCEVLQSKNIVQYISLRIDINKKGYVKSMDEQDYLGMYITGDLERWLPILEAGLADGEAGLADGPYAQLAIGGSDQVVARRVGDRFSHRTFNLDWGI